MRARSEVLEDVERLADRGAAAGRRRHAEHLVAAVVDRGRPLVAHGVVTQVATAHEPRRHRQRGVVGDRWVPDGVDDLAGDLPAVEELRVLRERAVGAGQSGVLEACADLGQAAVQEQRPARGERRKPLLVVLRLLTEGLVDHEPALGQPGRRREHLPQSLRAPPVQGGGPGGGGARHAHGHAAGDQVRCERRVGHAGVGVDERVVRHHARSGLAAVDRVHPAGLRVVVDEVAAATDAGAVGLGHAQRGRGGHRRVDGVAAVLEHPQPDPGGVRVDRGDRAAPTDGGRVLGRTGIRLIGRLRWCR